MHRTTSVLLALLVAGASSPAAGAAQGPAVPPPYDHGSPNLATLQLESALSFDQRYAGSTALRVRWDWARFAIGGAVGAAFGEERTLLLAVTPQVKLFDTCEACLRRVVGGVFADGARVAGGAGRDVMTGAIGLGAAAQFDFVGWALDVSAAVRGGAAHEDDGGDGLWGAALSVAAGIPLSFELLANVDYTSWAPQPAPGNGTAAEGGAWTLGFGLRVRIGPGT